MESGNEYLLQLKGNSPNLHKAVKQTIKDSNPIDVDYTLEKNRSRVEHRESYVYKPDQNKIYNEWCQLNTIIHIKTYGKRNGKSYQEDRYYISSRKDLSADYCNRKIRDHWKIENCLHWVKDKILNEDDCMIKSMKLSENVSALRNVIINLFRLNGENSIKYAIEKYTNRLEKCCQLIHKFNI